MNQARKNVRSTKPKPTSWDQTAPLKETNALQLRGMKIRVIYTKIYDVHKTVFSNIPRCFPTCSQCDSKYIMVMVEIDSNAIQVKLATAAMNKT
jgi:hypothetical protein